MKLSTGDKGTDKQKNKRWLQRPPEKVFIIAPREMQDGSTRAFETVKRVTAIEYAFDCCEEYERASYMNKNFGDRGYNYYALQDSPTLYERLKRGLSTLMGA